MSTQKLDSPKFCITNVIYVGAVMLDPSFDSANATTLISPDEFYHMKNDASPRLSQ